MFSESLVATASFVVLVLFTFKPPSVFWPLGRASACVPSWSPHRLTAPLGAAPGAPPSLRRRFGFLALEPWAGPSLLGAMLWESAECGPFASEGDRAGWGVSTGAPFPREQLLRFPLRDVGVRRQLSFMVPQGEEPGFPSAVSRLLRGARGPVLGGWCSGATPGAAGPREFGAARASPSSDVAASGGVGGTWGARGHAL